MTRFPAACAALLLVVGCGIGGADPAEPAQAPPPIRAEGPAEELLRLHHEQRVAHVLGDAATLTARFAPGFLEVRAGSVLSPSPEALEERFTRYFQAVRFLEWEDARPPRVRVSPDDASAEVIVEKRVRTIPTDTLDSRAAEAATFAWVERWVKADASWLMTTIASTARATVVDTTASLAARVRAFEILRRARGALGGEAAVARVATVAFTAECEGPTGSFVTEVASARDGRVSFAQRFPSRPSLTAGTGLEGSWHQLGEGEIVRAPFEPVLATVIAAHEMHLLVLAPESRYTAPVARPSRVVDGALLDVVEFSDALGAPARFLYAAETGLPWGFEVTNHTGRGEAEVRVRFDDWRPKGEVLLPFRITVHQGEETYVYRIMEVSTDWLPDRVFGPPEPHRGDVSGSPRRPTPPPASPSGT